MKLQLQLQYNSVQNDKKDSQSHKASHLHWMSHTISVFLFFSIMAIVNTAYCDTPYMQHTYHFISVASATSFTFNSFAVVNENMCQFSTQSTTAKEINNDFTQRTA